LLKLRARMRLATRLRTPGLFMTIATRTWRCASPLPGMSRAGGAVCAGAAPIVGPLGSLLGLLELFLEQVGQTLAGRHHWEDVLLLGDDEVDQRGSVNGAGRGDGRTHFVGVCSAEGGNAVRLGELQPVRAHELG